MQRFSSVISTRQSAIRQRPLLLFSSLHRPFSDESSSSDNTTTTPTNNNNNAFGVLGLPVSFDLDKVVLKQAYWRLMAEYHPDRHGDKPFVQQHELEDKASAVTAAYETLKEPHTRAVHQLHLLGNPMEEAISGDLVGNAFLMDIMEIRETIAQTTGDTLLKPMLDENQKRIQETCEDLAIAFQTRDLQKALELTARLQYWKRIEETLRDKMDSLY